MLSPSALATFLSNLEEGAGAGVRAGAGAGEENIFFFILDGTKEVRSEGSTSKVTENLPRVEERVVGVRRGTKDT